MRDGAAGFDVAVIGAGVVGLAVAAAAARRGRSVLILESESGIARGVTSRNSEVVHAGIYYPQESLKAQFCVEGRKRLYDWCCERSVPFRKLGKLIVATDAEEASVLADLLARGEANGVEGLSVIDAAQVQRLEPAVSAVAALHSPETGIVDAHAFCLSLLAAAEADGAVLAAARSVDSLEARSFGWRLGSRASDGRREEVDVGGVVDAAGLSADRIAALAGLPVDALGWRQHPCKGDYFKLAPGGQGGTGGPGFSLDRLVYPVPQVAGLGIHVTLDLAGQIRFGPDATYLSREGGGSVNGDGGGDPQAAPPEFDFEVDAAKAPRFAEAASRYLPALAGAVFIPDYAGIRPKLAAPGEAFRDFVVEEATAHGAPGFFACIGIESPGLTAALAIGEHLAEQL
ncbi:MAG: NAD(P)/FAD-dependent oxidoreductase [Myxococcota bacterium]